MYPVNGQRRKEYLLMDLLDKEPQTKTEAKENKYYLGTTPKNNIHAKPSSHGTEKLKTKT